MESQPRIVVDVALDRGLVSELIGRRGQTVCIVIDILRATSTLCALLDGGCSEVLIAESIARARAARALDDRHLLAGEVRAVAPIGFDFGNSPVEMSQRDLRGRTVVFATTNGTGALEACAGSRAVYAGAFCNATAVCSRAVDDVSAGPAHRSSDEAHLDASPSHATESATESTDAPPQTDILIVCAGRGGAPAYDDTICAGYLVQVIERVTRVAGYSLILREGARIALRTAQGALRDCAIRDALEDSDAARSVKRAGLDTDLDWCARVDSTEVVPAMAGFLHKTGLHVMVPATPKHENLTQQ